MVIAGTLMEESDIDKLTDMGVKDSKLLTPRARESLFDPIKDKFNQMKINQVEMVTRAKRLPPDMTGEIVGYIHPDIKYQPPSNNSSKKGGRSRRKRNTSRKRKHNTSRKRKHRK